MKRILAFLLALLMVFSISACSAENPAPIEPDDPFVEPAEGVYPIHWDLTEIYPTPDDFYADCDKLEAMIADMGKYEGTLHTPKGLYEMIAHCYDGEFCDISNKVAAYASLSESLDMNSTAAAEYQTRVNSLITQMGSALAYVEEEILELPLEERQVLINDPILEPYRYFLRVYGKENMVFPSQEERNGFALGSLTFGRSDTIYNTAIYGDMETPVLPLDGGQLPLTDDGFSEVLYGGYDRDTIAEAETLYYGRAYPFINTLTAVMQTKITEFYAQALFAGMETTRSYIMGQADIEPEIFDDVISAAHDLLPELHRFCEIHKKGLGVEDQYICDVSNYRYVSSYNAAITYDDAIDQIRKGLSVLGDDYIAAFDEMVTTGHIDVYPSSGKKTGAFEKTVGVSSVNPYVMLNFSGYAGDASDLAHELGHAMYDYYSLHNEKLNGTTNIPIIFTQEVASTCNELLYYSYQKENAETEEQKLFYLENILRLLTATFFRQSLYAEFEDYMYQTVENGGILDAETVSQKWLDLYVEYFGDSVTYNEMLRYRWPMIPHFYYGYYVYQYATSMTYSSVIARRILSGDKETLQNYKTMLSKGCSATPSELLKIVGVDPTGKAVYEEFAAYYTSLVDEYETMVNAREP